eukprot:228793_1
MQLQSMHLCSREIAHFIVHTVACKFICVYITATFVNSFRIAHLLIYSTTHSINPIRPKQMSLCLTQMIVITSFVIIAINGSDSDTEDADPGITHSQFDRDEFNVLHFRNFQYYRDLWMAHTPTISHQHQTMLRSETVPIDYFMTPMDISLNDNTLIQQILEPFLVNSDDDKVRIFKYDHDDANKPFVIFEVGNQKITRWMQQMRSNFPYDGRFHSKKVGWAPHSPAFQTATVCTDMKLMRDEYQLIQAQLDVVINAHELLSNHSDPTIRYLTHWIDVTASKWLHKNVYGSNCNLSLSQIKDIIETQSIHTDAPYDLTFTLFVTSDNYESVNGSNSYEQGLYLVPDETKKKYLLKLHNDRIILAISPSKMKHFIQYVNVKDGETVHNVVNESDRIWRMSSVMQTKLRNASTTFNDMIHNNYSSNC